MRGRQEELELLIESLRASVDTDREHVNLTDIDRFKRADDWRNAKHPVCPYDGTPLDVDASSFACPLVRLPNAVAAQQIAADSEEAWRKAKESLRQAEDKLSSLSKERGSLEVDVAALSRSVASRQAASAAIASSSQSAWAAKGLVRRMFELYAEFDAALQAEKIAKHARKELQARQLEGLARFSTSRLFHWFDFLIRRVVSPEAHGTIVLDGHGLHPNIDWWGIRRSVALNSLQIVLFDLSAVLCSVEGRAKSPAFLVHDSPREGDLDRKTYERLFEAIFELAPDPSTAPFQYIVTTTTDPPLGRVRDRVRLKLGADVEENRLFMVDL